VKRKKWLTGAHSAQIIGLVQFYFDGFHKPVLKKGGIAPPFD